jgi:hypothetical protein
MYAGWKEGTDWRVTFATIDGKTGTFHLYRPTKDGAKSSAVAITAGIDANGKPLVEMRNADGSAVTLFGGSVLLRSPNGNNYIQVSDDGIVLKGPITQMGGLSTPGGVPLVKYAEFAEFANSVLTMIVSVSGVAGGAAATTPAAPLIEPMTTLVTEQSEFVVASVTAALTMVTKGT